MAVFNFQTVARDAPRDPRLHTIFAAMTAIANPNATLPENPARNERPFLSPLAWAYFFAFETIVQGAFAYAKVLEIGVEDPDRLFSAQKIQEVLKAVLPHQSEFIEKSHLLQYYHLVNELEEKLLKEIDRMLRGEEQDEASAAQAAKIIAVITKGAMEAAQRTTAASSS
jgi:hypothetical protein